MAGYALWLQNASYPARWDRQLIEEVFGRRERITQGLQVSQAGSGDDTVDVTAGVAIIAGDDEPDQGFALAVFETDENLPMPASPASDSRIDLVAVQINDPVAGGGAGDNATIVAVEGTAGTEPSPPNLPPSAVLLARVERTSGESAILDAAITASQNRAAFPYTIGTGPAPNTMIPGDLYIRV